MNRTAKRILAVTAATPLLLTAGVGPANAAAIHVELEPYSSGGPSSPFDLEATCDHPLNPSTAQANRINRPAESLSFKVFLALENNGAGFGADNIDKLAVNTSAYGPYGSSTPKAAGGGPYVNSVRVEYFDNTVLREDYPETGDPSNPSVFNEEWDPSWTRYRADQGVRQSPVFFEGRDNVGAVRVTVHWKIYGGETEFLACSFFLPEGAGTSQAAPFGEAPADERRREPGPAPASARPAAGS